MMNTATLRFALTEIPYTEEAARILDAKATMDHPAFGDCLDTLANADAECPDFDSMPFIGWHGDDVIAVCRGDKKIWWWKRVCPDCAAPLADKTHHAGCAVGGLH